jgi:hypothetical protein
MKPIAAIKGLYALAISLVAGLGIALPPTGACAARQANAGWVAAPIDSQSEFIRSSGAFRVAQGEPERPDNTGFFPRAFAPGKLSLIAGSVGVDVKDGINTELWFADLTGRNARRLTTEPLRLITWVEWSGDGTKLACVTEPVRAQDRFLDARLIVADVRSGRRVLIAEGGALHPRWSSNATALYFWKRDGNRWQPYRAATAAEPPALEAVAPMALSLPGAFSPDALRVAGVEGKDLLVETLATHHRATLSLPVGLQLQATEWSPDSQWLYLQGTYGGIVRPTMNYAVRLSDGKVIPLDTSLGVFEPLPQGEHVQVTTANWLPQGGHRLLLWAHRWAALTDRPVTVTPGNVPEPCWLVYDADTGTTAPVAGLEKIPATGSFANPVIQWAADGRAVLIGNQPYHFHAAPP